MTGSSGALLINLSVAVGLLVGFLLLPRVTRSWRWSPDRLVAFLDSPWAPVAAGLLTCVIVRSVWGSFAEPGIIHDERAYLLQAEIFARGRWTAAVPPIPAFFEQMHVFVEPAVFAKYPPAHAIMLVPGIWLGLPGLMPTLLAGVAGALTFWLARRLSHVWVALLTWMLWTTAPATLLWATSYLSESTSLVMWLAAASATVLWLESRKQRYLVCVAVALAWGFEARPLTMLALAAPLGFVIVRRFIQSGGWRAAALPMLIGAVLLGLGPVWNHQTLGHWTIDPYPHYSRMYFPFDKPGFGVDPAPPLRQVPPELTPIDAWARDVHRSYVPSAVPVALAERIAAVLIAYAAGWRLIIGAFLLGALLRARGAARVSIAASLSLFVAYLVFAHPSGWVVYYVELLPALHFLAADRLVRVLDRSKEQSASDSFRLSPFLARVSAAAALLLLPVCLSDLVLVRAGVDRRNQFNRQADQAISTAPLNSIVFVRYAAAQNPHRAITRNEADLGSARTWVVYDRGAENARLLDVAPDRTPYRLNASTFQLEPLSDR